MATPKAELGLHFRALPHLARCNPLAELSGVLQNRRTMKPTFKSFALGSVCGALLVFAIGAGQGAAQQPQQEYKLVEGTVSGSGLTLGVAINREIPNGWELVSVHPTGDRLGFALLRKSK